MISSLKALKEKELNPRQFAQEIIKIWCKYFALNPTWVNIKLKDLKAIDTNYFYVYWLMIQCQENAIKIHSETWKTIAETLDVGWAMPTLHQI